MKASVSSDSKQKNNNNDEQKKIETKQREFQQQCDLDGKPETKNSQKTFQEREREMAEQEVHSQ